MVVGVDFDNTLINYDDVFFHRALELGLVQDSRVLHKRQVRDQVRLLPEGELLWQQLQAYVYTEGMGRAHLIDGVKDFFSSCQQRHIQTYIVSHKTMYASVSPKEINLRDIALEWMRNHDFFDPTGLGLNKPQVYFESTRLAKIERIRQLGCTHFIDDLQEVFLEEGFPPGVKKILYSPGFEKALKRDIIVVDSWKKIYEYFFN